MKILRSIGLAVFLAVIGAGGFDHAEAAGKNLTVVELFTSQGCSSCPAADRILSHYAQRQDVLALSFHVDY